MANQEPDELGSKREVGLLDKACGIQHQVCTLTIYGYVMGNPPPGVLSHIPFLLEMALLNQFLVVVKLGGEGGLIGISIITE